MATLSQRLEQVHVRVLRAAALARGLNGDDPSGAHGAGILTAVSATPVGQRPALEAKVMQDLDALAPHLAAWDELAVAAARPFCAPAWMLSWWREGRTGDARLRTVLVFDGDEQLAAVAPFFAQVGPFGLAEYRLLAAGFSHRIGLLSRDRPDAQLASSIAGALASAEPPPASVVLEGVDQRDPWPELLAAAWPGRRAKLRTDVEMDAPAIELGGDYEGWLARRERKFRKEARRTSRRLEEGGVGCRIAFDDDAVGALMRLHDVRWRDRGGSALDWTAQRVLAAAGDALDHDLKRIAITLLDGPDGPIAAELVLRAGESAAFWAGGFDRAWSRHAPGTQAMLVTLEAAAADGIRWVDLGGGAHDYKQRLADVDHPLAWRTVFPVGIRYPLIRLRLAPKHARFGLRAAFRRLPPHVQRRLRRAIRRGS
jgi:CelD/BcsL family acetyltransferase involved in cellulose biosynthesis